MDWEDKASANSIKRQDIGLCFMVVLVKFGDAVELFLPGVITQQVSCELGVSATKEAVLGIVMFLAMALATLLSQPIAECCSKRTAVLGSLYISILATVTCSVVHNYTTLLVSRGLVGFCVGLNVSSSKVLFSQAVSSARTADRGLFIANFGFAVGSGWVSILGYIFLEMLGWRRFILLVSIPWFIPPILLFHISLTPAFLETAIGTEREEASQRSAPESQRSVPEKEPSQRSAPESQRSARDIWSDCVTRTRILKIGGMNLLLMLHGGGTILLLPSLLRAANLSNTTQSDRCEGAVGGTEFLIMAGISGGLNAAARVSGYFAFKRLPFRLLGVILGCLITTSYGVLMVWNFVETVPSVTIIVITIGTITACWSMMLNESILAIHDYDIFPAAVTAHTSAVCWGLASLGTTAGNGIASFVDPVTAIQANFAISFLLIAVVSCTTERVSVKRAPALLTCTKIRDRARETSPLVGK